MDAARAEWVRLSKAEGTRKFCERTFEHMPDFPCFCGSTMRLWLREKQTRCADEQATQFYLCDRGHEKPESR